MTLLTACRIQLLDVSLTTQEYAEPLVTQIMLMNFNLILRKSQIGQRETTWHYMKISLSTYAILPTDVILSTSFPLITNIFNIQHQLAPLSLLLISSVIWAFQFPAIYPGHHTYDLVVIRLGRWQFRFSASSTLAILGSC